MSARSRGWKSLTRFTNDELKEGFSNTVKIDNDFMVVAKNFIHRYNTQNKTWTSTKFTNNEPLVQNISYDHITKRLYILDIRSRSVIIHDMNTNQCQEFPFVTSCNPRSIFCNGKLHVIGGQLSDLHGVWNEEKQCIDTVHNFTNHPRGIMSFSLAWIKSRQEIAMVGGVDNETGEGLREVRKYSAQGWLTSSIKLPEGRYNHGIVTTQNGKFMIVLGGSVGLYDTNKIFIVDTTTGEYRTSEAKLPFYGPCTGTIMFDKSKNELLVHGWIRKEVDELRINFPFTLTSLAVSWHKKDYLHVLTKKDGRHYKIRMDKIMKPNPRPPPPRIAPPKPRPPSADDI